MREVPGTLQLEETETPAPELILLIAPEPRFRVFLRNLRDLFRQSELAFPRINSAPADFWPDVFVDRGLPWHRFLQSGFYHVLTLALIWAGSRFIALHPPPETRPAFTHSDVIYYSPSEYLPPLDTRRSSSAHARPADPEYSAQPIISVPPEADNRSQTIVTPPKVRLQNDAAVPNVVALLDKMPADPRMPIGPAPAVPTSEISRLAPAIEPSVIAPPPALQAASPKTSRAPQPSVIAPPPPVEAEPRRRLGDLNVGRSSIIAPAPQLSLEEQRQIPNRISTALRSPQGSSQQVIAPPPSLPASGRSHSAGSMVDRNTVDRGMIALNLHPAIGAPPDPPAGNRRGNFATTPEGHRGASGAPGASGKADGATDGNTAGKSSGNLPSGLYVGKASNPTSPVAADPAPKNSGAYSVNPNLIAGMRPPRLAARTSQPEVENKTVKLSSEEQAVFGDRHFYSLSLNMPNLNSAGGSWIIRFAALKPDSAAASPSARAAAAGNPSLDGSPSTDLSAPVATRKVDPAYPLELMRQNVAGTVILYAIIHADGSVGKVRVLRSVDDRLDQFASEAIAKWQFQPATKNGAPVDVEATFWIPFHPVKPNF
jgi:TonB family protein